jgi:hypothetical protein
MTEDDIYRRQQFGQKTGFGKSPTLLVVDVIFTRIVYADDGSDAGIWRQKVPRLKDLTEKAHASQVVGMDYSEWWRERVVKDEVEAKTANKDIGQLGRCALSV